MSSCWKASSHLLNYLASTIIFILGGIVLATCIYLFITYGDQLMKEWWLWVSVAIGVALLIVALVGCISTYRYNRCLLSFYLIFSGVLLLILLVVSITVTVYGSAIHSLQGASSGKLLDLKGQEATVYKMVRSFYLNVYEEAGCSGGVCRFNDNGLTCTQVKCTVKKVGDTFNYWLEQGARGLTTSTFASCLHGTSTPHPGAASAWCVSDTTILDIIGKWALTTFIILWVVTAFVLLLFTSNLSLVFCQRRKRDRAQPIRIRTARDFQSVKV